MVATETFVSGIYCLANLCNNIIIIYDSKPAKTATDPKQKGKLMNIKHAQYVLTVLKEGSITNAAKKLYVSQPSLSQMIKLAENNLGAPIFNRNTDPKIGRAHV